MNTKQLKRFLELIEECDYVIQCEGNITTWEHSEGMREDIMKAAIQRKQKLLDQLSNRGINLEESL